MSETLKSLNKEDLLTQTLLDPETYEEAYKPLLEEIKAAGNGAVTKAARDSALVLAKLAENFHKNYGVPLKLAMVKVGEVVGISKDAYGIAAFDVSRSGISSVSQFMDRIKAGKTAGEKPNKIRYTGKFGVSYSEEQVSHATTLHRGHVLTKEQMDDIENHLDVLHNPALSRRGDALSGRYHGKSVLCRIDGDLGSYYVVLEVSNDNGVVWFKTGMAGEKESIDKIIAEHSAGSLSYKDAGTTSQNNSAITIDSLPNALGIVKKDAYHQMVGEHARPENAHQLNQSAIENELQLVKEKYWNTDEWMKAPDSTPTKLTERQWLIAHSDTFREWFGDWETVEKVTKLYYENPIVMTEGGLKEKLEKAARDNGINIAADADSMRKEIKTIFKSLYLGKELSKGYREPGRVKNLDGELISITVSSAKELRHHSTNPRTLFLAVNLDSVIENATFLYEEVKDESRVKKSNQTTLAYRYYATRVVVNGEECIARIIVRKDKNGNLYFYDGDITSNEQIKKDLPKYLYPDTKTGQNLGKSLFTHSIQEWLAKVKETTDKIGGNGEVLASVVNDFEESSTYHQMVGEHARNTPEEAIKKEIANCAPRVLASKNEASVPPGKEFAISIPNIQKGLGIVKKGANRKRLSTRFSREALIGSYLKKKSITFYLLLM